MENHHLWQTPILTVFIIIYLPILRTKGCNTPDHFIVTKRNVKENAHSIVCYFNRHFCIQIYAYMLEGVATLFFTISGFILVCYV
jgi:hypothetical protein